MKAVLSNKIYLECDPKLMEELKAKLTYKFFPPENSQKALPIIRKNYTVISPKLLAIPYGRQDLIPEGYEIVDKRITVPVDFPEFRFSLRDSQQKVWDHIDDSCIINAWVSWGKTFSALAIAAKLGQKTLVVVDTLNLVTQWRREVEKCFGFIPGIIGQSKFDVEPIIVIGVNKSCSKKIDDIKDLFGTVIIDECHHSSSLTISNILENTKARYKIGLSGTLHRKDNTHIMFPDYFGHKVYQPEKENYMTPEVIVVKANKQIPGTSHWPWARRVNSLMADKEYIELITSVACSMELKGHKVLVVADRVEFLQHCAHLAGDKAICIIGDTGGAQIRRGGDGREAKLAKLASGEKTILFGTQRIFSEGFSESSLSCLIMATPINNESLLTQLIGRVIRLQEGKITPEIVDIHLLGHTGKNQASTRMAHYVKEGYKIRYIE
jgi:superfamily II DNA or RNA helicase